MISSSISSSKFWVSSSFMINPCSFSLFFSSSAMCFLLLSSTFFSRKKSSRACSSSSCSMYLYVAINLGITTCSNAFTLLLVTLIFSSKVKKDAWREAISISKLKIDLNFYRQIWIEWPPLSKPIWLIALSLSSNSRTVKLGISTPAIFSYDLSNLIVALLTASTTLPLKVIEKHTEIIQLHI